MRVRADRSTWIFPTSARRVRASTLPFTGSVCFFWYFSTAVTVLASYFPVEPPFHTPAWPSRSCSCVTSAPIAPFISWDAPNSDEVSTKEVNCLRATLPPGSRTHTEIVFWPSASLPGNSANVLPLIVRLGGLPPDAGTSAVAFLPPTASRPRRMGIWRPLIFAPKSRSRGLSPPTRP